MSKVVGRTVVGHIRVEGQLGKSDLTGEGGGGDDGRGPGEVACLHNGDAGGTDTGLGGNARTRGRCYYYQGIEPRLLEH